MNTQSKYQVKDSQSLTNQERLESLSELLSFDTNELREFYGEDEIDEFIYKISVLDKNAYDYLSRLLMTDWYYGRPNKFEEALNKAMEINKIL